MRIVCTGLAVSALVLAGVSPASADLVYLSSGRTLSVKQVSYEGEMATLTLRMGGEVVFERSLIARVEPDEVPYPEPVAAAETAVALPASPLATGAALTAPPPAIPQAFDELVTSLAKRHGVDARLVHAVITVESAYQPRARSPKGARGLMQLMPATAQRFGVTDVYDPGQNIAGGVEYLAWLLKRFNGDTRLAAAGYNAGEGAVDRHGGVPPYAETQVYVERVGILHARYRAALDGGLPAATVAAGVAGAPP